MVRGLLFLEKENIEDLSNLFSFMYDKVRELLPKHLQKDIELYQNILSSDFTQEIGRELQTRCEYKSLFDPYSIFALDFSKYL